MFEAFVGAAGAGVGVPPLLSGQGRGGGVVLGGGALVEPGAVLGGVVVERGQPVGGLVGGGDGQELARQSQQGAALGGTGVEGQVAHGVAVDVDQAALHGCAGP